MPCGTGQHFVRWEAGSLRLPTHPDVEGELVLAAFGAAKARCIELAEAWSRHADDLSVLAVGPRGPADEILVTWDDVSANVGASSAAARQGLVRQGGIRPRGRAQLEQARLRRDDMLMLLALGYPFQVRLIGQIAAAHAGRRHDRQVRPALIAALAGRLAPTVEAWLGLDPDQLVVTLHNGPGWGSAELTGRGENRRLRVSLPTGWLAQVWACGLALTGRHLVVAVAQTGWPGATVLALRSPGTDPVPLSVHGHSDGGGGRADAPHWEV